MNQDKQPSAEEQSSSLKSSYDLIQASLTAKAQGAGSPHDEIWLEKIKDLMAVQAAKTKQGVASVAPAAPPSRKFNITIGGNAPAAAAPVEPASAAVQIVPEPEEADDQTVIMSNEEIEEGLKTGAPRGANRTRISTKTRNTRRAGGGSSHTRISHNTRSKTVARAAEKDSTPMVTILVCIFIFGVACAWLVSQQENTVVPSKKRVRVIVDKLAPKEKKKSEKSSGGFAGAVEDFKAATKKQPEKSKKISRSRKSKSEKRQATAKAVAQEEPVVDKPGGAEKEGSAYAQRDKSKEKNYFAPGNLDIELVDKAAEVPEPAPIGDVPVPTVDATLDALSQIVEPAVPDFEPIVDEAQEKAKKAKAVEGLKKPKKVLTPEQRARAVLPRSKPKVEPAKIETAKVEQKVVEPVVPIVPVEPKPEAIKAPEVPIAPVVEEIPVTPVVPIAPIVPAPEIPAEEVGDEVQEPKKETEKKKPVDDGPAPFEEIVE